MQSKIPSKDDLLGSRVLARPYSSADASELFEAASESVEEMYPFMPWCHPGYTLDESEAWTRERASQWEQGVEFSFAIRTVNDEHFVGGGGLNSINYEHRFANLGYWIRTSCTKRGFASEAVELIADFGLQILGLSRLEIVVALENTASLRVAEKVGAMREGVLRGRLHLHGKAVDSAMFSIVRDGSSEAALPARAADRAEGGH